MLMRPTDCHFAGIRRTLHKREKPLSQGAFDQLLETRRSPYTGRLPGDLAREFGDPRDFLKGLDGATEAIRRQRKQEKSHPKKSAFFVDNTPVRLEYIASGALGAAYRLQVADQDYVLKVFHQKDAGAEDTRIGLGNRAEQRIGLTLSRIPFKNFSAYHVGNPDEGWILYERFTPEMDFDARPGEYLEDFNVMLTDHDEFIHGVKGRGRVDHGGILIDHRSPIEKNPHPWSEMLAHFQAAKQAD